MGREYTITNVQRRDEWPSKFGTMQDYAITVEGDSQGWIKLTQKPETTPPRHGDTIYGSIVPGKTANGNTFRKFKKENPNFPGGNPGGEAQTGGVPSQDIQKLMDDNKYIIEMLEELTLRREAPESPQPRESTKRELAEAHDDPFEGL